MWERLSTLFLLLGIVSIFLGAWLLTILFVYWDTQRRSMARRQRLLWLALAFLPFMGFIIYLFAGPQNAHSSLPSTASLVKKRITAVKRPSGPVSWLPTITRTAFARMSGQTQAKPWRYIIAVTAGPHQGQEFIVNQLPALIGRVEEAGIRLPEDMGVSRRHAELYRSKADMLWLRDLNSSYGTSVNGASVGDTRVKPGDIIEVGHSRLVIKRKESGE